MRWLKSVRSKRKVTLHFQNNYSVGVNRQWNRNDIIFLDEIVSERKYTLAVFHLKIFSLNTTPHTSSKYSPSCFSFLWWILTSLLYDVLEYEMNWENLSFHFSDRYELQLKESSSRRNADGRITNCCVLSVISRDCWYLIELTSFHHLMSLIVQTNSKKTSDHSLHASNRHFRYSYVLRLESWSLFIRCA